MKTYSLHPDEITSTVLNIMTNTKTTSIIINHQKCFSHFLKKDNGVLSGGLLHICSMIKRIVTMEENKTGLPSLVKIDAVFSRRGKKLTLYILNAFFFYTPFASLKTRSPGRQLNIQVHLL